MLGTTDFGTKNYVGKGQLEDGIYILEIRRLLHLNYTLRSDDYYYIKILVFSKAITADNCIDNIGKWHRKSLYYVCHCALCCPYACTHTKYSVLIYKNSYVQLGTFQTNKVYMHTNVCSRALR